MNKIYFGKTTMTHGLKGELKLYTEFSLKEKVLKKDFPIYIANQLHHLSNIRFFKNHYLIEIDNLKDINLVEEFRHQKIYILENDLHLKENEFIIEKLLDYSVFEEDIFLGKIREIIYNKNGYLILVFNETHFYIPFNDYFILKIIDEKKCVLVKNTKGLRE